MNFFNLRIGIRLGFGFGIILVLSAGMLIGALVSTNSSRTALLETIQRASKEQDIAVEMRVAMLNSAVSVRNMGLQSKVEGVQKDEAQAKKERAAYLSAKSKLESLGLDGQEKEIFARLAEIDQKTDGHFKDAVDLSSQFNTEQANAVITEKIDPLSSQAGTELAGFIALQKKQTEEAIEQANASNRSTVGAISIAGLILLTISVVMAWTLTVRIIRPLQSAVDATHRIAQGDLVSAIAAVRSDDKEETAVLLKGLLEMRNSLATIVSEVRSGAEKISNGANEIASGNSDLSHRTETQASNLEETAASMEQLSATVKNNAETARQANQMAASASAAASHGGEVVGQVVATMSEITASSSKIADIIGVIDGIAFQTNILALNAAVEAARAGEQGRGFAVVASEVRSLAGRSAEAAKEIKSLIGASVERIEAGSSLVSAAGDSINDIVLQVKQVAELIGEISSSANEQTSGIDQIKQAVVQLDNVTQQNAALVEEAAAAADSLNHQASRMVEVVRTFKLEGSNSRVNKLPPRSSSIPSSKISSPRNLAIPTTTSQKVLSATKVTAKKLTRTVSDSVTVKADGDDWETF